MNIIDMLNADVLVVGASRCAHRLVSNLNACRLSVILAIPADDRLPPATGDLQPLETGSGLTILSKARVTQSSGATGDFRVWLENETKTATASVKQVVIAPDSTRTSCLAQYNLTPAGNVRSLSDYVPGDTDPDGGAVAFLIGLVKESNPEITQKAMAMALDLHATGKGRAYILTRNLKVAENGLERLYRETKAAGVTYIKFEDKAPELHQSENGALTITFDDEYTRTPFRLTPNLVIVDEAIGPSPHLAYLADIFRLHTDPAGFIQKENVHRVGIFTNRRGIYAVGPARGILPLEAQWADADDAAQTIAHQINAPDQEPGRPTAEISTRRCVRCLTCYRLCPYGAIRFNTRVNVIPAACEGCGLCTAECPQKAITLEQLKVENVKNLLSGARAPGTVAPPPARIVAFCCSRSALPAGRMASWMGQALPPGLTIVEVPCAGGISIQHLLAAFETRADGVLVLTCHLDNCHSDHGNQYAGTRVSQLQGLLRSIGMAPERLALKTLASNMGAEFAEICSRFENDLKALGPL